MLKRYLSVFFTVFFIATIIAPSVLLYVDDTIDISYLLDASEEEEEKGKEKNKELEVFVVENLLESEDLFYSKREESQSYTYKKYANPHLNLISPPPEFI
ncbi:MAG: hypothetical protein QNK89_07085 [Lacinutrix sp.]|uniref:hypothetical protein n=1 Tax=Lacinutrix sp. TaxID=1937692 RepID=UPI00309D2CBC